MLHFLSVKSYLANKFFDYKIGWTLLISMITTSLNPDEISINSSQQELQEIAPIDPRNNKEVSK